MHSVLEIMVSADGALFLSEMVRFPAISKQWIIHFNFIFELNASELRTSAEPSDKTHQRQRQR